MSKPEPTKLMLEIGAKLYPRRYRRFKDIRSYSEACEWAMGLDWRCNPYDRFLLRREILHHLESESSRSIFMLASREEIATELDQFLNELPGEYDRAVFGYVLFKFPWHMHIKRGHVRYNRLT